MTSPIEAGAPPLTVEKHHFSDIELHCPLCKFKMSKTLEIESDPEYGHFFVCRICEIYFFEKPLKLIFAIGETTIQILPEENLICIYNINFSCNVSPFYIDFSNLTDFKSYLDNLIFLN